MKSIRAFIAIQLPSEIQESLELILHNSQPGLQGLVRWVPVRNIHITLKFLGNVPHEKLADLETALGDIAGNFPPFAIEAKNLGAFPTIQRAKVIWVGIEPNEALHHLYLAMEEVMNHLGFPKEDRQFSPHLTLARVNDPASPEIYRKISSVLTKFQTVRAGSFLAKEITLFRSDLTPHGSIYTPLAKMPLGCQDKVK